jgi:CheY-like chemotaxis protein
MIARILVIEDDPIVRSIVKGALEARGFLVDAVEDGFSAIPLIKRGGYDVALIDYQLPDMDGYASARLLRDLPESGGPKLIAMTGNTNALMARSNATDLFEIILPKPLDLPTLFRSIEAALRDPQRSKLTEDASRLWHERGLPARPKAKVLPEPTREQTVALGVCFDLVEWPEADLILLTNASAAPTLEELRSNSDACLLPVVALDARMDGIADASFRGSAPETWGEVARAVTRFEQGRRRLPERYRHALDLEARLLAYLAVSNRPLAPTADATQPSCVRYRGFFPEEECIAAAERLVRRGLLDRRFADRFHACGSCGSHRLNVREECPNCRSPNLTETALLHHYKCAYEGPENDFRSGSQLICPKCRQQLRHYGGDYDRPGLVHRCGKCEAWNSEPAVGFSCLDCGGHTDGDAVTKRDLFAYTLTKRAQRMLANSSPRLSAGSASSVASPVPSEVADAIARLAEESRQTLADFAVIEIQYKSQQAIVSSDSVSVFDKLRRLFVENLSNLLAEYGHVFPEFDKDYVVVGANDSAALSEFATDIITCCQNKLARDLTPTFRILSASDITSAA